MEDWFMVADDQTDFFGDPWPNVPVLDAQAVIGGAHAAAGTSYGTVSLDLAAVPGPGRFLAEGFAEVMHYIDFETSLPETLIGAWLEYDYDLETAGPFEAAGFEMYALADLYQWLDDDGDGIRDDDEWHWLDDVEVGDMWFVAGGDDNSWSYSGAYWFDPLGPGVYSLGLGGWGWVGAATLIPAPGAWLLASLGAGLIAWLRRR